MYGPVLHNFMLFPSVINWTFTFHIISSALAPLSDSFFPPLWVMSQPYNAKVGSKVSCEDHVSREENGFRIPRVVFSVSAF